MPGFDRTGPGGIGPMAGWGRGYCSEPGNHGRPRYRIYRGYGSGGGRGWRNRYWSTGIFDWPYRGRFVQIEPELTRQEQMQMLQEEAKYLESELKQVKKEIENMNKSEQESK
jgi:hypothetical protein